MTQSRAVAEDVAKAADDGSSVQGAARKSGLEEVYKGKGLDELTIGKGHTLSSNSDFAVTIVPDEALDPLQQASLIQAQRNLRSAFKNGGFPSWLEDYSQIQLAFDSTAKTAAASIIPVEGAKPIALIGIGSRYLSQGVSTVTLGHELLHFEAVNNLLYRWGGTFRELSQSDATAFGVYWSKFVR